MQFHEAIGSCFRNYVKFAGRAPRSEYWYWYLFVVVLMLLAGILDGVMFPAMDDGPLAIVIAVVAFLPGLAVAIRRLHDLDRTGWWFLIAFTIIGAFVLWIWFCIKGTTGANRFGPDPLAGASATPTVSPPGSA